jgi:hypothetical protein
MPAKVGNFFTATCDVPATGEAGSGATSALDLDVHMQSTIYPPRTGEVVWPGE